MSSSTVRKAVDAATKMYHNSENIADASRIDDSRLGDETAADCRALTIDTTTRLYDQWNMRSGTSISDITKHPGITCIDGHHRRSSPSLSADEAASAILSLIGLPAGTATTSSITYTNWAHLPEWIEKVLDVS